jgi:hypothetical protein
VHVLQTSNDGRTLSSVPFDEGEPDFSGDGLAPGARVTFPRGRRWETPSAVDVLQTQTTEPDVRKFSKLSPLFEHCSLRLVA